MKKIIKTVLTAALIAGSTSVFAQKLGCINMQELIFAMPETAEMQKNLEAYQKELQDQLETISVEFNNKLADYTKLVNDKNTPMSDSVKQLKEKELNDLKTRYDEFAQMSQQDMQKRQGELLEPIIVKAQNAVTDLGYYIYVDLENLQTRLRTLSELTGQQSEGLPIADMDGLGLIIGDYAEALDAVIEHFRDMRSAGRVSA